MDLPKPLYHVITHPADYELPPRDKHTVAEVAKLKTLARHSKTIGLTFVRDEPLYIALVDGLARRSKCSGFTYSPVSPYVCAHWIALDAALLTNRFQWRVTLHHELAHALSATFGKKVTWKMQDPVTLALDGCAPDLDRWSWHMQRAMDQLEWSDGTRGLDMRPESR